MYIMTITDVNSCGARPHYMPGNLVNMDRAFFPKTVAVIKKSQRIFDRTHEFKYFLCALRFNFVFSNRTLFSVQNSIVGIYKENLTEIIFFLNNRIIVSLHVESAHQLTSLILLKGSKISVSYRKFNFKHIVS